MYSFCSSMKLSDSEDNYCQTMENSGPFKFSHSLESFYYFYLNFHSFNFACAHTKATDRVLIGYA